jgi:hypothetical protein
VQRIGASRVARRRVERQWGLAPIAELCVRRMTSRDKKLTVWGIAFVLLLLLSVPAVRTFNKANKTADDSAHAALATEIEHQLAAVQPGQRYPDSLSHLRLTYPDGGSSSLLSRFNYHSTGTNCTFRTVLRGEEFVRSFP